MNNDEIEVPRPERLESACRIFVNQAGYQPWDEKYAVLAFPASFYTEATKKQVLDYCREKLRGKTAVLVTHDISEAEELCACRIIRL